MSDITSADVAATLFIDELYPNGVVLEEFGADSAITAESVQQLQTKMTIDGKLVAGYAPEPQPVTLTFQPSSPVIPYIKTWRQSQQSNRRPYKCRLNVRTRATGSEVTYFNGFLSQCPPMAEVGKTLGEIAIQLTFERAE